GFIIFLCYTVCSENAHSLCSSSHTIEDDDVKQEPRMKNRSGSFQSFLKPEIVSDSYLSSKVPETIEVDVPNGKTPETPLSDVPGRNRMEGGGSPAGREIGCCSCIYSPRLHRSPPEFASHCLQGERGYRNGTRDWRKEPRPRRPSLDSYPRE
ncbi:uncharacterized protein CEXT_764621, partial [Caerostris extrusa]